MSERKLARRWRWRSWIATPLGLAAISAVVIAANPQQQKKAASDAAAKTGTPTKQAAPAQPGASEPIVAIINGQKITRKALAEECIARKGADILDTMIAKMLVLQECNARGIKVTAQEIDAEIAAHAKRFPGAGGSREAFLRFLKEQRDIDPDRYAQDIVWPGLALKKLAAPTVKVTESDIEQAFDAQYGEKMRCRWIMVENFQQANKVWEVLRKSADKNGGKVKREDFEREVTMWSADTSTRANGGLLQPISHHTGPTYQQVEKAAFALKSQGEISSVVQLGPDIHVILYCEGREAPQDVKLADVRKDISNAIYEAKLREEIDTTFVRLKDNAKIVNLLTGNQSMPEKDVADTGKATKSADPAKSKEMPAVSNKNAGKTPSDTIKR